MHFLEGDQATEHMTDAVGRVSAAVPYLRAEVGDLGPYAEAGSLPQEGEWIRCAELVHNPDWLEAVIADTGSRLGTDDPVVAASLFVQNYSYRVLTLAIACLTAAGVVPDSSAPSMAVTLANGRPSAVRYLAPRALAICEQNRPFVSVLQEPTTVAEIFDFIVPRGLDEHVAVLIESTRARIRVGARLLWGNVAASIAVAFRTMEGCLGEWVRPLGEQFFENAPTELQGLGTFLALKVGGHRGWYWERTNCCLYDRLPGNIRCSDCSRTPTDERRSAYLASLSAS